MKLLRGIGFHCEVRQKYTAPMSNTGAQRASFDHILRPRAKLQANEFEMV